LTVNALYYGILRSLHHIALRTEVLEDPACSDEFIDGLQGNG